MLIFCYFWIISFTATISSLLKKKKQQGLLLCFCILTWLLTGLRWEYGGDWDTYYAYFRNIHAWDFQVSFEYGWVFLNTVSKRICNSYTFYQFVIATIILICTYKFIKELSPAPMISYLVLISSTFCGIGYVRTMLATFILMLGITYIIKKEKIHFLLCVIAAGMIHTSALIAFPTYWIYHSKLKYKYWILIFIGCTLTFYIIGSQFLKNMSFLGPYIEYKLNKYIAGQEAGETYGAENQSVELAILGHVIKKCFLLVFLIIFFRKELQKKEGLIYGLLNIYIVSSIFYCSFVPIALQLGRMCGYFECVDIILFACVFHKLKGFNRYLFLGLLIIFSYYRLAGKLIGYELYYNYHSILTQ